jgi:hypothetical protein
MKVIPETRRTLCSKNEIGDEFHYLFSCDHFNNHRKLYIKEKFRNRPSQTKTWCCLSAKQATLFSKIRDWLSGSHEA